MATFLRVHHGGGRTQKAFAVCWGYTQSLEEEGTSDHVWQTKAPMGKEAVSHAVG